MLKAKVKVRQVIHGMSALCRPGLHDVRLAQGAGVRPATAETSVRVLVRAHVHVRVDSSLRVRTSACLDVCGCLSGCLFGVCGRVWMCAWMCAWRCAWICV